MAAGGAYSQVSTSDALAPARSNASEEHLHPKHNRKCTGTYLEPWLWGVNREDLTAFGNEVKPLIACGDFDADPRYKDPYTRAAVGPSVHSVSRLYVKPLSKQHDGLSWSLMKHEHGLECKAFATHAWVEGVFEFLAKVKNAWPVAAHMGMYICFLSNPQVGVEQLLEHRVEDSPFHQVLSYPTLVHMLVVPNFNRSIYTRLWCVYEAYVAVDLVNAYSRDQQPRNKNFTVSLAWEVDACLVVAQVIVSMLLLVLAGSVSYGCLAHIVAPYVGPMMWLVLGFCAANLFRVLGKTLLKHLMRRSCISRRAFFHLQTMICHCSMVLMGLSVGVSAYHLSGAINAESRTSLLAWNQHQDLLRLSFVHWLDDMPREQLRTRFESGEELSCVLMLVSMVCVFSQQLLVVYLREVIYEESQKLDFNGVTDAAASNEADKRKLLASIAGNEEKVDDVIKILRWTGRYNRHIATILANGISSKTARNGVCMHFKTIAAVCAWQFWWISDLAGHGNISTAFAVPLLTCTLFLLLIVIRGDWCIFLVEAAYISGLCFVVISNHPHFFVKDYVLEKRMTQSTWELQLVLFSCMVLVNILFYTGHLKGCLQCFHNVKNCLSPDA
mmetsp:Transcript_47054/g.109711  ORF Transcript_47054/g.109711 Transcript_47054/m.109711 type:complete len:612 (+) Transcript_47054:80-1915(+)